jgi:hypothetical protein
MAQLYQHSPGAEANPGLQDEALLDDPVCEECAGNIPVSPSLGSMYPRGGFASRLAGVRPGARLHA